MMYFGSYLHPSSRCRVCHLQCHVFGTLKTSKPGTKCGKKKDEDDYTSKMAKNIASCVPGYSGKYSINNADAIEETQILDKDADTQGETDIKNVDLCQRIVRKLILAKSNPDTNAKINDMKVTLEDVTSFDQNLITQQENDQSMLRKHLRHERLYLMMKNGYISNTKTL